MQNIIELHDKNFDYYQFKKINPEIFISKSGSEFGYESTNLSLIDLDFFPLYNSAGYKINSEKELINYINFKN